MLEVLREPLETGRVTISRAARSADFPAAFQLIAAMNPCPCGYHGDPSRRCSCSPERIERYRKRISGPLLDRIDLHSEVARPRERLAPDISAAVESSKTVRARVAHTRDIQMHRQAKLNHVLSTSELGQLAALDPESRLVMRDALERFFLSPRAYHRILKVARTIADLAAASDIRLQHLHEALNMRCLDRAATG